MGVKVEWQFGILSNMINLVFAPNDFAPKGKVAKWQSGKIDKLYSLEYNIVKNA